ncbi:protein of unknown function [Petrocella atlantisensis]|uniref:Uncharacterized protein n=1 Tax=Petrocella atlantisensis TaxID=2173034 RepID=A0A3P7NSV3_9FIRM|nr:protein of unknown function [Petrocella atlantisensis]
MVDGSLLSSLPISANESPSLRDTSIWALSSRVRCAFFAMVISPWILRHPDSVAKPLVYHAGVFATVNSGSNFATVNSSFWLNELEFNFSIQHYEKWLKSG